MKLKSFLRRFSVYGDIWPRYLHWSARHCPWFLEPIFMFVCTLLFWLVCGKPRKAVATNLLTILPGSSLLANHFRVFRVFWNFAWTMTDLARVRHGQDIITWEVVGRENLVKLEQQKGAILLTAHMGNYDVAAPVFAHHFTQPIHIVRAPERQQESQEFQQDKFEQHTPGTFVIHYNEPGNMLGLALAKALGEGGVVAIQGDRVMFDVSPMRIAFKEKVTWQVPRGPFTLALVGRTSIHPVFIIRMGYRRYRVQAEKPIVMTVVGRDKETAQVNAANEWNAAIRPLIEKYWYQWFVLESVFEKEVAP